MIELLIRSTLVVMSTGHNMSGAGLLSPLKVGIILMPPSHMTLAKPKSGFLKLNLHTIDII